MRDPTSTLASSSGLSTQERANILPPSASQSSIIAGAPPRIAGGTQNQTKRDFSKWYDQFEILKPVGISIADLYVIAPSN